jgi:HEAT repeat protein
MERILKGTNYLLWTKAPKEAPAAQPAAAPGSVEIWIVPRESSSETAAIGQRDVPADPLERAKRYLEADAHELVEQARSAPDPKLRADAVALLVHAEKDAEVSETIVSALHDPDPRVRKAALHIVGDLDPEAPGAVEAITEIARADESPQLRMRALRKLFEEDYPPDVAENSVMWALQDPHEDVRNLARNLLELVTPQGRAD